MSLHRRAIVGYVPDQLAGLNSWSFLSGTQLGLHPMFFDVAYRQPLANAAWQEGNYILVGNSTASDPFPSTGQLGHMVLLDGDTPMGIQALTGSNTPIVAVAASGNRSAVGTDIIALGQTGISYRGAVTAADTYLLLTGAPWNPLGNWIGTSATPTPGWPVTAMMPGNSRTYVFGQRPTGGATLLAYYKARSDFANSNWTQVTSPTPLTGEGYAKGVHDEAGRVLLVTSNQRSIVSTSAATFGSVVVDQPAGTVIDVAWTRSHGFLQLRTNRTLWGASTWSAVPIPWQQIALPARPGGGTFQPVAVVGIEPQPYSPGLAPHFGDTRDAWVLLQEENTHTWWATSDFISYYRVNVPGTRPYPNLGWPLEHGSKVKFVGNRLFVFTHRGVAISGPLCTGGKLGP